MNAARAVVRALASGFVGTAAMVATTAAQKALAGSSGPVDYDDSLFAVRLLERWTALDLVGHCEVVGNQVLRFGYGSGAGLLRHALEGRVRHPTVVLFAIMWGSETVLLRAVGTAPAPWRWQRHLLATSVVEHVVYAAATDRAYRALAPSPGRSRTPGGATWTT